MNSRLDKLIQKLKGELGLFLSISFGEFLFMLFFQPFPLQNLDMNNTRVFDAGFGGIIFLTMILVRTFLPWVYGVNDSDPDKNKLLPPYLEGFLILLISAIAAEFYLRYVGFVKINFFVSFQVFLISLAPPVVLYLYDTI
ncbi:MAG: hypothetical protein WCE64_14595, partial [Bacteroidales bacterium]